MVKSLFFILFVFGVFTATAQGSQEELSQAAANP